MACLMLVILTRRIPMASTDRRKGNMGVVAIVAIALMVALVGFLAWRGGMFGGDVETKKLDVNITTPN
jgi:hypothetical protein